MKEVSHGLCRPNVFEITGKLPGKNWHRNYLKQHGKTLKASKSHHLGDGYFRLRARIGRKCTAAVASSSDASRSALPVFRLKQMMYVFQICQTTTLRISRRRRAVACPTLTFLTPCICISPIMLPWCLTCHTTPAQPLTIMEIPLTIRQMPFSFLAQPIVCVTACHYPRTLFGDPIADISVSHSTIHSPTRHQPSC